jgi:hypothetical protein
MAALETEANQGKSRQIKADQGKNIIICAPKL